MKLVDMGDSKSPSERSGGSSPPAGTTFYNPNQIGWGFFMPKINGHSYIFRYQATKFRSRPRVG